MRSPKPVRLTHECCPEIAHHYIQSISIVRVNLDEWGCRRRGLPESEPRAFQQRHFRAARSRYKGANGILCSPDYAQRIQNSWLGSQKRSPSARRILQVLKCWRRQRGPSGGRRKSGSWVVVSPIKVSAASSACIPTSGPSSLCEHATKPTYTQLRKSG